MFKIVLLVIAVVLLTVFINGCSEDNPVITTAEVEETRAFQIPATEAASDPTGAMLAPSFWEWWTNYRILNEAKSWDGKYLGEDRGQCKVWVQTVVRNATGRAIPTNYTGGGTYHLAKWNYGSDVKVVWQGAYQCIPCFPSLQPGQIIQLRWKNDVPGVGGGAHTAIIKSINYARTSMEWWDCNFVGYPTIKYKVGYHTYRIDDWNRNIAALTVYQVQ